jgi:selenide,water dikinase
MEINISSIPIFAAAREFATMGFVPGGARRNREYYSSHVELACDISDEMRDILFDPQTSGGLLMTIPPDKAEGLLKKLRSSGIKEAAIIGQIVDKPKGKIVLRG